MGFFGDIGDFVGDTFSSLTGAGSAIFPFAAGGVNSFGAYSQNREAEEAAQKQMSFQDRMSSTAYQRTMADMKKAGLNPILAYKQGGASSPGGASYQPVNVSAPGVNTALAARRQKEELKLMEAQMVKTYEDAHKAMSESHLNTQLRHNAAQQEKLLKHQTTSASAAAREAELRRHFYSLPEGKASVWIDKMFRSINPFSSSFGPRVNK